MLLNSASGTNIYLELPVEGSLPIAAPVLGGGRGTSSPCPTAGLFSAQGYTRLEIRLSEFSTFTLLFLSLCQEDIFATELKYNCSLQWKTNAIEFVQQGFNAGSFPSHVHCNCWAIICAGCNAFESSSF